MLWPSGGAASPIGACAVVSGTAMLVRSSTSDLPRLKVDARIDQRVGEIGDEIHQKSDERKDVECREHHGVIAVEHALEAEQTKPIEREYGLDQERTGEEGMHERGRKARDHD